MTRRTRIKHFVWCEGGIPPPSPTTTHLSLIPSCAVSLSLPWNLPFPLSLLHAPLTSPHHPRTTAGMGRKCKFVLSCAYLPMCSSKLVVHFNNTPREHTATPQTEGWWDHKQDT